MTRENKLALVVGFGLILFVGILISDHFSTARSQRSADLTERPLDPLARGYNDARLIEVAQRESTQREPGDVLTNPTRTQPRTSTPPHSTSQRIPDGPDEIVIGGHNGTPGIGADPETVRNLPHTFHNVRTNETLTSIANHYYNDPTLAEDLAKYNNLANPNEVRKNHRLRIPDASVLIRGGAPARPVSSPSQRGEDRTASRARTYTVQSGDTLSEIAQDVMGSAGRWRELYNHNRAVIANPDNVVEGTVLRIP